MKLNEKKTFSSKDIVNQIKPIIQIKIKKINYLYPKDYLIETKPRWFKGSRDRGLNAA